MTTIEAEERALAALLGEEEDAEARAWAIFAQGNNTNVRRVAKADRKPCRCGCGRETNSAFAPGHDGRVCGWVLAIERGKKANSPSQRDARRWHAAWVAAGKPGGTTHPKVKELRVS